MTPPASSRLRHAPDGVTIMIPNWNHEYLLPRSVGSALRAIAELREHGVRGEVLVVDDGSRDGSPTLLRQAEALYFEDGLRVEILEKNGGMPARTRNVGIESAFYRYICFLDSDDALVPENLWHFYRAIKQTGAAVVFGNMTGMDETGAPTVLISNESYQQRLLTENYIGALIMADRAALDDSGGISENPDMIAREDWELNLHLASNGRRLVFVPLLMGIYYHQVPGSMTKENRSTELHQKQQAYIRRVYNQLGLRAAQPLNTRHLRYHPDIGYL